MTISKAWNFWVFSLMAIAVSSPVRAETLEIDSNLQRSPTIANQFAQMDAAAAITDVQIHPTPNGLEVILVFEGALPAEMARITGNALIVEIPNATLNLADEAAAEQFSPIEGIALIQVTGLPNNRVQIAVTGTEAAPEVQTNVENGSLVLSIVPGTASTVVEDSDTIQLVVTATRTETDILDVPRSVTVITRDEIEQQSQFTNNLPDILGELVPGLGPPTLQNRTRNLSLRGRTALILIDGIPQNPNTGFATELSVIDPAAVERIEVVRGPSAIYGDGATGGIINIITRSPIEEGVAYNVGVGTQTSLTSVQGNSFGYNFQAGAAAADDRADGRLTVSYDIRNGQFDANGDRIPPETGIADTDRLGILAKLGYDLDEQQRLGFTYSYYQEEVETEFTSDPIVFDIPGLQTARALQIGEIDYDEEPQQTNHVLNLTYRHAELLNSQLDAQLYYRDTELVQQFTDLRSGTFPAFFPRLWQTSLDASEWGARVQLETPLGNSASLLWGADYSQEDNERPLLISDPATFDDDQTLNIVNRSLSQSPRYDLNSLGIFAQARWDITEQWQISGGLRYDSFDFSVDDYQLAFRFPREREGGSGDADDISFNAGVIYRPIPAIGLFTNFAQGFSIPSLGAAFGAVGPDFDIDNNLFLEPQKVNSYEIGIRTEFRQVQASLAGFYNESDLGSALQVGADGLTELVRAPQRNYGVEATVDWQHSDVWRLGGYFSWNEGENDVDDDGEFLALSSVQVQPYKVGFYVENDTTPGWTNRLQLLAVGGRDRAFDADVDGFDIDGYVTLDFLSSLQLGRGKLTLGIENLLNNQYLPVSSQERIGATEERRYAAPGTTLSLRYSVTF
ncbi:TonB-dependent receptor [Romeria aff. gracilis LEGE 07310]|uniref:TonB-dependent receptor n=1 Tax=Vasconcelosia minhoensis LEGE 07310 TaxID=915328 RepID=A0A8J7D9Z3_9CYAN|nr:TonB-dependent receptor [Romeria gracilis]MBE9075862.1 TonB-dependent receptor [Romeria aff. gracilis LEGE 07310]